jgi:hypothetical protein
MGLTTVALYVRIPASLQDRIEARVQANNSAWGKRGVKTDVVIAALTRGLDELDADKRRDEDILKTKRRRAR